MTLSTRRILVERSRRRFLMLSAAALGVGLNARAQDYPAAVLVDQPLAYYRLNDPLLRTNINFNSGSHGAGGNATNLNARAFPGAIAGDSNLAQFYDSTARSIIPWNAALNPANTLPFTMEAWFYPATDQINPGQAVVANRYSYPGEDRQGWVIFQRAPNATYEGAPGNEGIGWNFRMYLGQGGSSGLNVTSGVDYQVGQWTHVAVAYDPVQVTNATLTMYINGVPASTNIWAGEGPGYVANTDDHPPDQAPDGPAGLALGSYNNTQPGSNPYFGAVDEFAFYNKILSPQQILAHYHNGTNSARAVAYPDLIQSDGPVAYLRLDELPSGPDAAVNLGNLQGEGLFSNTSEVVRPTPSALAAPGGDSSYRYHHRNGSGTTSIPFRAANNPEASVPFTLEAWLRPTSGRLNPGAAPIANRYVSSGNRTGWVIFQRAPNEESNIGDGVGWNFRMFTGSGTGGQDVVTGVPYTVGEWQHLVVTWQPTEDTGVGSWVGVLTAYVNGELAASNESATYAANTDPTEDGSPPSDLAVGSYNAASGLGNNPFEGDIDEFAFYNNYILTPEQILAHYQTGVSENPETSYATLVLMSAYDGAGAQRSMPATYLRLSDPALYPAANLGTLASAAAGSLVVATNDAAGPQPPAFVGFETGNLAAPLDGLKSWINLNDPSGLSDSNQLTLEAWIKPGATQGAIANIVANGTNGVGADVFLRISDGASYSVGASDGVTPRGVSAPISSGDLGGDQWIHLVGTYDGVQWALYRNGVLLGSAADASGLAPIDGANWAIGSTGSGWEHYYSGVIDEVAIYGTALTASQVQLHHTIAVSGSQPLALNISQSGGAVTLTWAQGTLQSSTTLNGTFQEVPGASSPYAPPTTDATRFYSLRP